ncbi:MAG: pentapeptide repeat-containing protein [Alphaproteobacteria bacterium]|nr:pentapeptide repeat-containing protein [Alphaproteobacteria bacterium]
MAASGVKFLEVGPKGVKLYRADLGRCACVGVNLTEANLQGANLELAALEDVDLHRADVRPRNLDVANFVNADRAN